MRTTLTLDDDVAVLIETARKQRNVSLKEVVNTALRGGLTAMVQPPKERPQFQTRTLATGKRLIPIDSIADALAIAEGENYR
jgi:hypothetical protein